MNESVPNQVKPGRKPLHIEWPIGKTFTVRDVYTLTGEKFSLTAIQLKINKALTEGILIRNTARTLKQKGRPTRFYEVKRNQTENSTQVDSSTD